MPPPFRPGRRDGPTRPAPGRDVLPPRPGVDDFAFRPMTEPDARQVTTWRYPAPYDFYDLPEEAWPDLLGLGDRFQAVDLPRRLAPPRRSRLRPALPRWRTPPTAPTRDLPPDQPVLSGFVCFGDQAQVRGAHDAGLYSLDALDLGLGLRPDLTGRGFGQPFFAACLARATAIATDRPVRLAVASFNRRAITTYERSGFRELGRCLSPVRGQDVEFLVMLRDEDEPSL